MGLEDLNVLNIEFQVALNIPTCTNITIPSPVFLIIYMVIPFSLQGLLDWRQADPLGIYPHRCASHAEDHRKMLEGRV